MRESHIARKGGGAWGKYSDCANICNAIDDPNQKAKCMRGCENAFPNEKDGTELSNSFPEKDHY